MKLIIDIPEVFYESLKEADAVTSGQKSGKTFMQVIYDAVAKGTPLDDVKAEIKQLRLHKSKFITSDCRVCVYSQEVLEIFDNIGKTESEE